MYELRAAVDGDLEDLYRIHRASMREHLERVFGPSTEEDARKHFAAWLEQGRAQVIEVDGGTVGYLEVVWTPERMELLRIVLASEHLGKGLGSAILTDLLAECAKRGVGAQLEVFPANPARRLYERFGFVASGTDGPAIVMKWNPPAT